MFFQENPLLIFISVFCSIIIVAHSSFFIQHFQATSSSYLPPNLAFQGLTGLHQLYVLLSFAKTLLFFGFLCCCCYTASAKDLREAEPQAAKHNNDRAVLLNVQMNLYLSMPSTITNYYWQKFWPSISSNPRSNHQRSSHLKSKHQKSNN